MRSCAILRVIASSGLLVLAFSVTTPAQEGQVSEPAATLSAVLSAACKGDDAKFATYLTADNASAFRELPPEERAAFLRRFSLADGPARPLISSDAQNHIVFRCIATEGTAEFRFGDSRVRENLAFTPVAVVDGEKTEFGFVREGGSWHLISLGLVLLDVPQLSKQWAEGDLADREDDAVRVLGDLAAAVGSYRRAWGKLPDSLAQLGPAPKDQASPEQASLVDEHLAAGSVGGYQFRYRTTPAAEGDVAFEIAATPETYGKTGKRSFLLDTSGKIHSADRRGAMATTEDPLLDAEKTP